MAVIILHSQYEEASRNLIASLGVPIPDGDDVMVDVGGVGVRIISDHAKCAAMQPTFRAYPVLLSIMGPDTYVLDTPETWQECLTFMDDPVGAFAKSRTMTKYGFRTRVLTFAERMAMDNSVVPELVTMRNDLFAAEVVDLDEVAKYKPVMLATGLATEARINEIIAGVTHA
jgi:hypothetical protein